jgi:hypothetical protein
LQVERSYSRRSPGKHTSISTYCNTYINLYALYTQTDIRIPETIFCLGGAENV